MTPRSEEQVRQVLVTGGAGFIGSHVMERLRELGWTVHALDNLSTGDPANVPDDLPFHLADVRSDADIARVFRQAPFDAVVHCAAQTSVERSMLEPELDREINVAGTRRLASAARAAGVRRFVFISSGGAIYGETPGAATEDCLPAPRSYYGLHKFAAEQVIRSEGVSHAVLRPSNVYGARQRADAEGGVIAIFLERLRNGQPLHLHGSGRQVRDFVHVSDVAGAIVLALGYPDDVVWNVASGRGTSIVELARKVAAASGAELQVTRGPRRAGDIDRSLLSPARLIATGAWGPPLSLDKGLSLTLGGEVASKP